MRSSITKVRVAGIKYSKKSEIINYLCPDKTLEEGDVVYLEDKTNPYFIYEINEIDDKDAKGLKKVLSKAIENEKVVQTSKYMDITKVKADAIVNSLGTHIKEFSSICHAIYHASKSKELEDYISKTSTGKIFDIKVTDAGLLPSNHIINIVMPYKHDDNDNEMLKKAFSLVVDEAIERKYKSIAIPYIGTGANGYNYEDINQTLNEVMLDYQYKKDMQILQYLQPVQVEVNIFI